MSQVAEVEKIARYAFRDAFSGDARLVSVSATEDSDHDGDPIFRVRFVYDTASERLDAKKALNVVMKLHDDLFTLDESRFPIASFVSKSDYESENPEAA